MFQISLAISAGSSAYDQLCIARLSRCQHAPDISQSLTMPSKHLRELTWMSVYNNSAARENMLTGGSASISAAHSLTLPLSKRPADALVWRNTLVRDCIIDENGGGNDFNDD